MTRDVNIPTYVLFYFPFAKFIMAQMLIGRLLEIKPTWKPDVKVVDILIFNMDLVLVLPPFTLVGALENSLMLV